MQKLSSRGTILVTGAAGLIGSAVVWALNEQGYDNILLCDYLGEGDKFKNLIPLKYQDYMEADDLLKAVLEGGDSRLDDVHTVFHLGACSSTTETDCRYLIQNNYEYTKHLAKWAIQINAKFVYASSAATYGDGEKGMDDKREDLNELEPLNMYGYSKHMFDLYAQKQGWLDRIVGLKYFNVFGPNEDHKEDMRSIVNKAFGQIKETGSVNLFKSYKPEYKDGEQMRDFLYVKDAADMTLFLAEHSGAAGLYNLGSGIANTWVTLTSAIFKALDKEVCINFIDMPEHLKPKYQYYTKADISKLNELGYVGELTPLEDAVEDYVCNYLLKDKHLGQ